MSVTLPPGRYHVIFRYRFPGILKIMAIVACIIFLDKWFRLELGPKAGYGIAQFQNRMESLQKLLLRFIVDTLNLFYYSSLDTDVGDVIQKMSARFPIKSNSTATQTPLLTYKPDQSTGLQSGRLSDLSSYLFIQCCQRLRQSSVTQIFSRSFTKNNNNNNKTKVSKDDSNNNTEESHKHEEEIQQKKTSPSPVSNNTNIDRSPLKRFIENSQSDIDSSFNYEGLVYRSPPTPPKHTKRSYRKRHARSSAIQGIAASGGTGEVPESPNSVYNTPVGRNSPNHHSSGRRPPRSFSPSRTPESPNYNNSVYSTPVGSGEKDSTPLKGRVKLSPDNYHHHSPSEKRHTRFSAPNNST